MCAPGLQWNEMDGNEMWSWNRHQYYVSMHDTVGAEREKLMDFNCVIVKFYLATFIMYGVHLHK